MSFTLGMDVSKWQNKINWSDVAASGVKFVFITASGGLVEDRLFKNHWAGSKSAGLPRGAYCYFYNNVDSKKQAQKLFQVVKSGGDLGEFPPVLDVEESTSSASRVKACLAEIERLFGRVPIIYTRASIWNIRIGKVTWASRYPLWVAHYRISGWKDDLIDRSRSLAPTLPSPWSKWHFWQITDKAPGRDFGVDANSLDLNFAAEGAVKELTGKDIKIEIPPEPPAGDGGAEDEDKDGEKPSVPAGDPWSNVPAPTIPELPAVRITAGALNVRRSPQIGNNVTYTLKRNEVRKVIEVHKTSQRVWVCIGHDQWLVVQKSNGSRFAQWENPAHRSPAGTPWANVKPPSVPALPSVRVTIGGLNVRRKQQIANNVVGSLRRGDVRKVIEVLKTTQRVWVSTGHEQWLVVEKRDGKKFAEWVT
ncbi:MAG: glycoside hydrolase family 25 protein [Anaerolineales bacterium]